MVRWRPRSLLSLLLGLLLVRLETSAATILCAQDVVADGFASALSASGGNYDPSSVSLTGCLSICSALGQTAGAVEDGQWCHCGSFDTLSALGAGTCNVDCPSGGACGGADGALSGSEATGDGTGQLPLTPAAPVNIGAGGVASWSVSGSIAAVGLSFLVDAGDGSPAFSINGTASATETTFDEPLQFVAPGEYRVTVTALADGVMTAANVTSVAVTSPVLLTGLECPPLVEPGVPYYCQAAASGSDIQLTVRFSDEPASAVVSAPGEVRGRVGRAPPQGAAAPGVLLAGGELELTLRRPFAERTLLTALRWFGAGAGDCQLTLMEGGCSATGEVFCPSTGQCSSYCPLVADSSNYTCDATYPIFCGMSGQCSTDGTNTGTCAAQSAPVLSASAVPPVAFTVSARSYGHLPLTSEMWAEPGWFAKVACTTGSLAYVSVPAGDGDIAASDDKQHLVEVLGVPHAPVALAHTCSAMGNITLTVSNAAATSTLDKTTACEIPVQGITLQVEQGGAPVAHEPEPPLNANFSGAFVVQTQQPLTIKTQVAQGAPVLLEYNFGTADVASASEEVDRAVVPTEVFLQTVTFPNSGTFTVRVSGRNQHTAERGLAFSELTLIVQHPVLPAWQLVNTSDSQMLVLSKDPLQPASVLFQLRLPSAQQLPTDASFQVDYGDGSSDSLSFTDASVSLTDATPTSEAVDGFFLAPFEHLYSRRGEYTVTVTLSNRVSREIRTLPVLIEEKIVGLKAIVKQQQDDRTAELESGSGALENEYRNDRNLTFSFELIQGTISTITVYNTSDPDNSSIAVFTFQDKNYPSRETFILHIASNQMLTMSFVGENTYETTDAVPVEVIIQDPIGEISQLKISLDKAQPENVMEKHFTVDFASPSTLSMCLVIKYGDISPMASYGDSTICSQKFPDAANMPQDLEQPMKLQYEYRAKGVYNVSVQLFNPLDHETYDLLITVSDLPCASPTVSFTGASEIKEEPVHYLMSQDIVVQAEITLDCNVTLLTKKRWEVFEFSPETSQSLHIMHQLPYWDKADLLIPTNALNPGLHMLAFTLTMEDSSLPENELYQTLQRAYIQVDRTPIRAGLIQGAVSKIVRGWSQRIVLDAMTYSSDPDAPDQKDFTWEWFCRRVGEVLPRNDSGHPTVPAQDVSSRGVGGPVPAPDQGGCFGEGPGPLAFSGGRLDIDAGILQPYQQQVTFVFTVVVRKDTRQAEAEVQVQLVDGSPPVIEVRCADALLCSYSAGGVIVNPQHNLGLRGGCAAQCDEPLSWAWSLSVVNGDTVTPVENQDEYLPISDANEVRVQKSLYSDHPGVTKFHVGLLATNGVSGNSKGEATYFLTVNRPPVVEGTLCECDAVSGTKRAVVDEFHVLCTMPEDPEGYPVEKFTFFMTSVNGQTGQPEDKMLAVTKSAEINIRLGVGENVVYYIAEDQQGATSRKDVCSVTTTLPTVEELTAFLSSPLNEGSVGRGDSRTAAKIAQALALLNASPQWNSSMTDEQRNEFMAVMDEQNDRTLEALSNMAVAGKDSIALTTGITTSSLAFGEDDPLKLSMTTIEKSVDILQKVGAKIADSGFATADEMKDFNTNLMKATTSVREFLAKVIQDETCQSVSRPDLKRAPKMHVENLIEYGEPPKQMDYEMELRCNMRDNVLARAEDIEKRLERLKAESSYATLQKMVSGDKMTINTTNGEESLLMIGKNITDIKVGKATVKMPEGFQQFGDKAVAVQATDSPVNGKTTEPGADSVSPRSSILSIDFSTRDLVKIEISNVSDPIVLGLPLREFSGQNCSTCAPPLAVVNSSEALKGKLLSVVFSTLNVTKPNSALNIDFFPVVNDTSDFFVMVDFGRMPTLQNHALFKMVNQFPHVTTPDPDVSNAPAKYSLFISSEWVDNRRGQVYIGIGQLNSSSPKYTTAMNIVNTNESDFSGIQSKEILRTSFTTNYQLRTFTSSCSYFDEKLNEWAQKGLSVLAADINSVTCSSSHLTSFGAGLFVEPNTIDFAYVFANAAFTDNLTIYMTLIVLLTLFILLLIWARWQDKKDVEKLGSLPLPDNKPSDKYLYEIMLFTGHKSDAATDSVASFLLTGDDDETGARTFGKPKRRFFRKSGQDAFVMAVPRPLGTLQYLRIWHDNSGKGRFASWFLQYVLVRDVQTGEVTTFVCNQWLAVEYDDGCIDRLIPVAGKEQMREFSHLFPHTSQQTLSDGHLWFSVFLRPPRSRFTRMQRVCSCFALLFLSMMVNAMWYEQVPSQPRAGSIKFGPLSLSPEQIAVGVMSNIIVFVPSLLIVFLFRKSRPRKLRKSRIDEAMDKMKDDETKADAIGSGEDESGDAMKGQNVTSRRSSKPTSVKPKKGQKKKLTLPWWGTVIAWIICIACIVGSSFIVWSYGIQFGNEKTTKWITSLFISFFSSILLIQPLKVFLSAIVISAIFKNVDLGSDDANEDEEEPHLASDEEWLMPRPGKRSGTMNPGSPYDKEVVQQIRKQRMKEIEMGVIVREIVSYAFFLWILFVLSYDNRDPNAYFLQKNLRNAFIKEGDLTNHSTWLDFSKVKNTSGLWYWCRNVIMQELRAQTWYDDVTPAYGLRGFLDDRVNRIMGYGMIRQVRTRSNTCNIHAGMRTLIDSCQGYTSIVDEDTASYCTNWTRRGTVADCRRMEYRYTSASALNSLPHVAKQDVYGGGGYVFLLTGRQSNIVKMMQQLEAENWIDKLTRAVFVEFSVYNAQVNLFGIATIFVEMTPGGGMLPGWRFDGVRLTRQAGSQTFVIICEFVYCLFILYFVVRELRLLCKMKRKYFRQYAVYAEWSIILLSFVSLIVYIMRYIETTQLLDLFKRTYGNGYVRLQYAQALDDLYGYLVGIIVFIATLKFIKLLRFNRRIGMLSATLKQTWGDLTGFFVIFAIAFGSFGLLFNLLLVAWMDDFKDWISAVESCFAMMLGKFHFLEMYRASVLAAFMFFFFAIYMNLIFVNVLLTIILKGFEQVKNDVTKQPNDYEIVDFLVRRFKKFFGMGGNIVTPLKDLTKEHQQDSEETQDGRNVQELPDKVSEFLDQVNRMYFDGNLDLNNKKVLKKTLRQANEDQQRGHASANGKQRPKSMSAYQTRDDDLLTNVEKELDDV